MLQLPCIHISPSHVQPADTLDYKQLPRIKFEYIDTGKVKYIERITLSHRSDDGGARLLQCIPKERRYLMTEVLFDTHESWMFSKNIVESLVNIAGLGGFNQHNIRTCMNSTECKKKVYTLHAEGRKKS